MKNQKTAFQVETVSKEQLRRKIEQKLKFQLVNVLSPKYYDQGSIFGSLKIPLEELDARHTELDKSKEVVVYCAGPECPASHQAGEKLAALGYNVEVFEGGLKEWKEAGYPMQ